MNDFKEEISKYSFLSYLKPLSFLIGIFFMNFLGRIVLSPLMPAVEKDLRLGHDEAGSLFFLISFGYCAGLFFSGFISSWLHHRKTIILSSLAIGGALLMVGFSPHLWGIRVGLLFMGVAAGFYLPSGIATLTAMVNPRHWGKAIAIHELAPNLGFIIAPLIAEVLLGWFSWRGVLVILGVASLAMGFIFTLRGKGGNFPGEAPRWRTLQIVSKEPSFWLMILFFSFGIGSSFGVYSMVPLYLVSGKGMDRTWANTVLALSRVLTVGTSILSGWITDHLGAKKTLKAAFLTTGTVTALIGVVSGDWIILAIFIQPILATAFFPAGFAALARIGSDKIKNVAVSLTVPFGFLIGGGAIPAGIGFLGEWGAFDLGFILLGGLVLTGVFLVRYLRFFNEPT